MGSSWVVSFAISEGCHPHPSVVEMGLLTTRTLKFRPSRLSLRWRPTFGLGSPSAGGKQRTERFWLGPTLILLLPLLFGVAGCDSSPAHQANPLTNPNALNAVVWTKKTTGTYFCADSVMYGKDGGAYMKQAAALDSGYQPEFGTYCVGSEKPLREKPAEVRSRPARRRSG
jgi:hypothetical protein